MKTRDILDLIIRIVGIYLFLKGLLLLGKVAVLLLDGRAGWWLALLAGVGYGVLGIYFLRGAPFLLKWACSEKPGQQSPESPKDPEIR